MNVVIHALLHVQPLRDYLLLSDFRGKSSELVRRFAALAKKLWNPRLFKSQVSPHEFLQEIARASGGKFRLERQGDPVEFLGWLLNQLHKDMGGTKRRNSSASCKPRYGPQYLRPSFAGIVFSTFQGELRVETQQILVRPDTGSNHKPVFDIDRGTVWPSLIVSMLIHTLIEIKSLVSPFLFLAVELPPPPLFQDAVEKNIIPQAGIHSVLAKFDGMTAQVGYKRKHSP